MIRRPPRSTQSRSSAASDVYKRQGPRRVRFQALEGVEGRPPLKKRPHERHRVLYAIAALVLVGKDLEQANVRTVRVGRRAPLRPGERVIMTAGRAIDLGDLEEVVGRGEIASLDAHQSIDVLRAVS